jgi:hypothetical protein
MSTEAHSIPANPDLEHDDGPTNGGPPAGDRLAAIRQRRKELTQKRALTLIVPGYGGLVAVRYKALPREEFAAYYNKLQEQAEPTENDNLDLLIRCCQAVLVRQTTDDEWEPFDLDQAEPTTFSSGNLATLLGEEANSAREEVKVLFSPDGSQPMAPEAHVDPLISWQSDVDFKVDRALLGE